MALLGFGQSVFQSLCQDLFVTFLGFSQSGFDGTIQKGLNGGSIRRRNTCENFLEGFIHGVLIIFRSAFIHALII